MSVIIDLKLFPKKEEWATGDESLDLRLSQKLKEAINPLTFSSISQFYFYAIEIKTRAHNPLFKLNIETVTKALLALNSPKSFNDHEFNKLIGKYFDKEILKVEMPKSDIVIDGLKMMKKFRYEDQLDFFIVKQTQNDRNPYLDFEIIKAPNDVQAKIIFKDFKAVMCNEKQRTFDNVFFEQLKGGKYVLQVNGLGEFWFEQDQIYSLVFNQLI